MTTLEKVSAWLTSRPDEWFCDGCIMSELGIKLRQDVNAATRFLSSRFRLKLRFARQVGKCTGCGDTRLVIQAPAPCVAA